MNPGDDALDVTGEHPHHARHHEHAARVPHDGHPPGDAPHLPQPPGPGRPRGWQWLGLVVAGAGCVALGAGLALLVHPTSPGGGVAAAAEPVPGGVAEAGAPVAPPATPSQLTDPRQLARAQSGGPRYPADTPVLLLGDSLAVGIAAPLAADWPQRQLLVDALEGRSTTTAATLLAPQVDGMPPVWVVSLGTNDAPQDFPAAANAIMQLAGPDRCVVWYDVHRAATDAEINAELAVMLEQYPNLHLIDWHDLANAHPEWFSVDDIHPSTVGYQLRARQAVQAVAEQCTSTP